MSINLDDLDDLTPRAWCALLARAAERRCIACGHDDGCTCSDAIDDAKELVADRAREIAST